MRVAVCVTFPELSPTPTGGRQLTLTRFYQPVHFLPTETERLGQPFSAVHLPARDFGTCRVTHQVGFPF
jgi:hypothetical protein